MKEKEGLKEIFEGIYSYKGMLLTKDASPNYNVYGEEKIEIGGKIYRVWNPKRSKLAGAIKKGLKKMPIKKNSKVLYLGASTGTTVSHISDILERGILFAVEISAKMMHSLLKLVEVRENIIPILADANKPKSYEEIGEVDCIYQDVAQKNQAEILIKNSELFLKENGYAMFCVKSQSIDVTTSPKKVFEEVREKIREHFKIEQIINLEPFDKEHEFLLLKKQK